jgi:hypothetical protein
MGNREPKTLSPIEVLNILSPNQATVTSVAHFPAVKPQPPLEEDMSGMSFLDESYDLEEQSNSSSLPTKIFGSDQLREQINALVIEFKVIFRRTLTPYPSIVLSLKMGISENLWQTRLITAQKELIVKEYMDALLAQNIIRRSNQPYYSELHMVPKTGGLSWRVTIDYRNLNKCATSGVGLFRILRKCYNE